MDVSPNFNHIVAKSLTEETKEDWFEWVKNYLISKDLWEVTSTSTCTRSEDPWTVISASTRPERENAAALHVIRICCGSHNIHLIRGVSEAKDAWDNLHSNYYPPPSPPPPPSPQPVHEIQLEIIGEEVNSLRRAISKNDLSAAEAIIKSNRTVLDVEFAQTFLHLAVKLGHVSIVEKLVEIAKPKHIEKYDDFGNTPLIVAIEYGGVIEIAKCLIKKSKEVVAIVCGKDSKERLPVQLAFVAGLKKMGRYLYNVTPPQLFTENHARAASFLGNCLATGELDIVLDLLGKCNELLFAVDDTTNMSTIEMIAFHLPVSSLDKSQLPFWKRMVYDCVHLPVSSLDKSQPPFWKRMVYNYIKIPSTTTEHFEGALGLEVDLDVQQGGEIHEADPDVQQGGEIHEADPDVQQGGEIHEVDPDVQQGGEIRDGDPDVRQVGEIHEGDPDVQQDGEIHEGDPDVQQDGENHGAHRDIEIPSTATTEHFYAHVPLDGEDNTTCQGQGLLHTLISSINNLLGIKEIRKMKEERVRAFNVLSLVCDNLDCLNENEAKVGDALIAAARAGNVTFLLEVTKEESDLEWLVALPQQKGHVFFDAIRDRRVEIFNLLDGFHLKHVVLNRGNDLLHLAASLAPPSYLNNICGAALQLQRELQWFKAVESMVDPRFRNVLNREGQSPLDVFKESHKKLRKEGEIWMKDTASSCSLVGTLIVTIMFAVAFTVPGGNNQTTGYPIFFEKNLFIVFLISDALSLFFATTSVLTFLGIVTSRYAEEDFLYSLPRKLIMGFSTLFLSIATMMVAFSVTLIILLQHNYSRLRFFLPIALLGGVPVTLFVLLQYPLLVELISSFYGRDIFKKKVEKWP